MKKIFCLSIGLLIAITTFGQSLKTFSSRVDALFDEGCHYYAEIGNKVKLQQVIDSLQATMNLGINGRVLDQKTEDSLLLGVKMFKLMGDYHYLNSDEDSQSYAQAESYFRQALAFTQDEANAQRHDIFYFQFLLHEELGQLYYKQKRYEEAYNEMKAAQERSSYLSDNDLLDFISQLAICEARIGGYKGALDNIDFVISQYQGTNTERYGEALRKKAKILMLQQEHKDTGMVPPTDEAMKCYQAYFDLKKEDAQERFKDMSPDDREAYWMRIRPFVVDCYRLEDKAPDFLYDVTLFSKALLLEYAQKGEPNFCTWKKVQKKLKKGECAIEFIQYEKQDKTLLGALVLKKKQSPVFIRIGTTETIGKQRLMFGGTISDVLNSDDPIIKNEIYKDSTAFDQIWTPALLRAIGNDTQKVYFAADGIFHQLAIEYMLPKQATLKSSNLHRLTSTRQLLTKSSIKRNSKILTIGGVNFFKASSSTADNGPTRYHNDKQAYQYLKSMRMVLWPNLPGTEEEIAEINNLYRKNQVTSLSDTTATESNFSRLASQYSIIHLATHGAFGGVTPQGTDLIPASYDESLSQNVLAFAGINSNLRSFDFDVSQCDGILSAREISQLDLSGVDLIVLSACQSGLGFLTEDGIYGLQRGLKNAGAKCLIVSLWSVDDDATSLLMQSFYQHLQSEDVHTAFMHAREDLIATRQDQENKFDRVKLRNTKTTRDLSLPQFSNAFILIDAN